jgi:hypothetical protein
MTESRIEQLAEQVLDAHGLAGLPVDPLALARLEEIRLAPGHYDGCFDGRIEYRRRPGDGGRFYLFYAAEERARRPAARVRFSVAHELGHFFLPQHRDYLVSGVWHGSRSEFVSARRMEREADWFAAALLMPRQEFLARLQGRGGCLCTLGELARLADRVFQTSLTSTAIRYAQLNFAPCCVVLSEHGRVLFGIRSEEMKRRELGWISRVPAGSVTGRLWAALAAGRAGTPSGLVDGGLWFAGRGSGRLREEVRVLGRTGRTLTYLVLADPEQGDLA